MRWTILFSLLTATPAFASSRILRPINVLDFESAVSGVPLTRRSDPALFAELTPVEQAQLVYGTPGANGQLLLANMTLVAPSGMPIVMMERLEGLTSAVDCSGETDGELAVTWESREAYDHALKEWEWVNEEAALQFLLVVNHDGCGPDAERVAYRITDVDTDEAALVTKLTAIVAPWKDITGTFSMDFGKATLQPVAEKKLRIRGWKDFWKGVKDKVKEAVEDVKEGAEDLVEDVKEGAKDLVEDVKEGAKDLVEDVKDGAKDLVEDVGETDFSKAIDFDVTGGEEGVKKNIFTDPFTPSRLIIDCANCFIKGKFKLQGTLKVKDFKLVDLSLSIAPSGFSAAAEIETTVMAAFSPDELNSVTSSSNSLDLIKLDGTTEVIEIAIPGAGLVVPGIFTLGLVASVETGFTMMFKGTVGFTMGLAGSMPDTARLDLNLVDMEKSSATGFEGSKVEPVLNIHNATAIIDTALFFRPKLALKAEVSSVGELGVDIRFGLPQINAAVKLEFDAEGNGVCGGGAQEKTGANFSVKGVLNVVTGVTGKIADIGGALIEKTLATHELFKAEKCVPFEISGLSAQR